MIMFSDVKVEVGQLNIHADKLYNFLVSEDPRMGYQRVGNIFNYLRTNNSLAHGTIAEGVVVYQNNEIVAYAFIENFENRDDKVINHNNVHFHDLGVIHFRTKMSLRGKGYASFVAKHFYSDIIKPLFERNRPNSFILATGDAVPIILKAGLSPNKIATEFYSANTFESKVLSKWAA